MGVHFQPPILDEALARIETFILPSIGQMLEGVLEAAAMARGGVQPEEHGAELRRVVRELELMTRQLGALDPAFQAPASELKISE